MRPDHAPTPFTAIQIRDGCPAGRRSTFVIERPGKTPFLQVLYFRSVDEESAEYEISRLDMGGEPLGEPEVRRELWTEFQAHSSYPAKGTTITETNVDVPAGRWTGFCYRVESTDKEGQPVVVEALFAKELPGPPVRLIRTVAGKTVLKVILEAQEPH